MRTALVALLAMIGLVGAGGVTTATPSAAAEVGSTLFPGQSLLPGDTLRSANGAYRFTMQGDGNAVLYYTATNVPQFATRTVARGSTLTLQPDGNVVVYSPTRVPQWHTRTSGRPASRLVMQDDGNLVVYGIDGRATWSSRSGVVPPPPSYLGSTLSPGQRLSGNQGLAVGGHRLLMQPDGNLVLRRDGRVLWHTGTQRNPGAYLAMQGDGNLVVYSAARRVLWHTGTSGHAGSTTGSTLRLQSDGNLVVYKTDGSASWSRNSGRVYSDKGFVLQSLYLGYDYGDFFGTARVTNRNPVTMSVSFTVTVFTGGHLVAVLDGYASGVAPGQTVTDEMYSWDYWVPGPYTITYQVDWTYEG